MNQMISYAEKFKAPDPDYAEKVHANFDSQPFLSCIGAQITNLGPGICEITLPFNENIARRNGTFHGGLMSAMADSAGGYAAMTLCPLGKRTLTVEYKLNFLKPGAGDKLVARGEVMRPGNTLTVTRTDVFAGDRLVATSQQTMIVIDGD